MDDLEEKVEGKYDASSIQVLEGLEAVRKRPGMYIGTTGEKGLHHLVWEIVDNAIDESLAGYCDTIEVSVGVDNSITVKDNGRGIPVDIHPKTGVSTLETVYTVLHAGGKFGGGGYKVSGGLHGVGASVVNALSKWLEVTVYRDGKIYYQKYSNGGKDRTKLETIGECDANRTGTTVTFLPDPTIFEETTIFKYDILKQRLREMAFLNRGVKIKLIDERETDKTDEFCYEGGISEYVKMLNETQHPLNPTIIDIRGKEDNVIVEVALQYNDSYNASIYSFVNNINTPEGGTHEDGVRRALTRVLNKYATQKNIIKNSADSLTGDDVKEGITMIISCKHPNPQFEGQTKTKLGNIEVRGIADKIFADGFERFLMENPDEAKIIIEKGMMASRARLAAKKARELTRRKGGLELTNQWGKLTDCSSKDASISEVFIVEGDSAAGTAKDGRDPATQAILPIRGKILNVEKARLDRALSNEEIRTIITAFGTGIGDEFNLEKLRYHKIILMADADVDGAHIRTLLLTFFFRHMRPLVDNGNIYIAQPPLFKIFKKGMEDIYLYNEEDLNPKLEELEKSGIDRNSLSIQRYKGLGEMDSEQLWETTMNPETRILVQVTLEDAIKADQIFSVLMGENVEPRREFIEQNAKYVTNLDI